MSAEADVVVIGSGHNAMTTASYLQKSGLSVLLVERLPNVGGASVTVETIPYYKFNVHSTSYQAVPHRPPFKDLGLSKYVDMILPDVQIALATDSGKALCIHVDPKKTAESIAKFSKKDADTYLKLDKVYNTVINKILAAMYYTDPFSRTDAEESRFIDSIPEGGFITSALPKTAAQMADETWESEEMKMIECLGPLLVGLPFDVPGSAVSLTGLPLLKWTYIVKGGSGNFALGMRRNFVDLGGKILENAHVDTVIVENGQAKGVVLSDGRRIMAKKFVVSGVDVRQTFERFIDLDTLPDNWQKGIKSYRYDKTTDLGVYMALREEPKYNEKLRNWDPNVDRALRMYIGYNSMKDVYEEAKELRTGVYSKKAEDQKYEVLHTTKWDPTQAPAGRAVAFFWDFVKCEGFQNIGEWDSLGPQMADLDKKQWANYAPNMTPDNILHTHVYTPLDIQRHLINMVDGGFQMRSMEQPARTLPGVKTPIKGYYYCGSGIYPGGGITMAPGYVAANVIAREEHIPLWWKPLQWGQEYPLVK